MGEDTQLFKKTLNGLIVAVAVLPLSCKITVGVTLTGSHVGLTAGQLAALDTHKQNTLHEDAAKILKDAGANYVVRNVTELPKLITEMKGLSKN